MISRSQLKLIQSLNQKKYRRKFKLFPAEGVKIVNEILISELKIQTLLATDEWLQENSSKVFSKGIRDIVETTENELKTISSLTTPNQVYALVEIPDIEPELDDQVILMLESIRDPGNLGTIIRIADWYGLKEVICSEDCVDVYNTKVIQAAMGSFPRVKVHYLDLAEIIKQKKDYQVYGAVMNGNNVHNTSFQMPAVLIIGNESNGISSQLSDSVRHPISIPRYGQAESLNASVATGIILDRMK